MILNTRKIILSLGVLLLLSGCSQTPKSYVESFYDSLKSGDVKKLQTFFGDQGEMAVSMVASLSPCPEARKTIGSGTLEKENDQEKCLQEAYGDCKYEILSTDESKDGQIATVTAKSKCMDIVEEKTFNLIKADDGWKMKQ